MSQPSPLLQPLSPPPSRKLKSSKEIKISMPKTSHNILTLRKKIEDYLVSGRLAGPDRGTRTGLDRTDFSAVRSQSKRPDRETVSIFGLDWTETFIAQAFINKLT